MDELIKMDSEFEEPEIVKHSSTCTNNNNIGQSPVVVHHRRQQHPSGVNMNLQDKSGKSLLIHCCVRGLKASVEELCKDQNIDVNLEDNEGNTALIHAAQSGHAEIVALLIERFPGLEIDHVNKLGQTALIKAAIQGRVNCARILLRSGADPNKRDNGRQFTAMEWAKFVGRNECAKVLNAESAKRKSKKTVSSPHQGNLKQVACLAAIPLIGNNGIEMPEMPPCGGHRPRVRSAPPKCCCVKIKITPPSSPQFPTELDWQRYWEYISTGIQPMPDSAGNQSAQVHYNCPRPKSSTR